MDGYMLEHSVGDSTSYRYKPNHPYVSNNIIQMRSGASQPPFYGGAQGQIPYNLGMKNPNISIPANQDFKHYSFSEHIEKKRRRKR
jgi:hypothetical protein